MKEFHVLISDENYSVLNFTTDELPGVAVVNTALKTFEPKEVFSWHLSIMVEFNDVNEKGMPTETELEDFYDLEDRLDYLIKGENKAKPNALFLGRITWNGTRELVYRVFDPEVANDCLQKIINENSSAREFEYSMRDDEAWELTEWHLKDYE